MTVRHLLTVISSAELTEWAAYEKLTGPLGSQRADMQAAIIAATVANSMGGSRKAVPADFIPKWDRAPATPEQLLAKVRQLNSALGGETVGNNSNHDGAAR